MNKVIIKRLLIIFLLIITLSSCGQKNIEKNYDNDIKKHKLGSFDENQIKDNIKKLDKEGKKMVIEYFSSTDETKKQELKKEIDKHMIEIQSGLSKIKGKTIEEKNKEIQKITKKIKLYRKLGF